MYCTVFIGILNSRDRRARERIALRGCKDLEILSNAWARKYDPAKILAGQSESRSSINSKKKKRHSKLARNKVKLSQND